MPAEVGSNAPTSDRNLRSRSRISLPAKHWKRALLDGECWLRPSTLRLGQIRSKQLATSFGELLKFGRRCSISGGSRSISTATVVETSDQHEGLYPGGGPIENCPKLGTTPLANLLCVANFSASPHRRPPLSNVWPISPHRREHMSDVVRIQSLSLSTSAAKCSRAGPPPSSPTKFAPSTITHTHTHLSIQRLTMWNLTNVVFSNCLLRFPRKVGLFELLVAWAQRIDCHSRSFAHSHQSLGSENPKLAKITRDEHPNVCIARIPRTLYTNDPNISPGEPRASFNATTKTMTSRPSHAR